VGDRFDVARGNACRTVYYLIDIICTACDDFIIWPKGSNLISNFLNNNIALSVLLVIDIILNYEYF